LLFGVWVDRVRRRHIMLGANLTRMVLIALIPLLYWLGVLHMTSLLIIACAIGIASVLFDVSWMSYVPTLVKDPMHYVEASSKMGISSSSADVAGPGLAGLLVAAVTAPLSLVADACSYLISVVTLLSTRTLEPPPAPPATERHELNRLNERLTWLFRDP